MDKQPSNPPKTKLTSGSKSELEQALRRPPIPQDASGLPADPRRPAMPLWYPRAPVIPGHPEFERRHQSTPHRPALTPDVAHGYPEREFGAREPGRHLPSVTPGIPEARFNPIHPVPGTAQPFDGMQPQSRALHSGDASVSNQNKPKKAGLKLKR